MDDEVDCDMLDTIRQYQNSIIKHSELGNDAKILNYITKLYEMPITVAHLQDTGIGRTVNSLRKYNGDVGNASRAVVNKWKTMVAKEEEENISNPPAEDSSPSSSSVSSNDKHTTRSDSRSEDKHRSKDKHERRSDSSDKHSRKHESSDKSSKSKHEDSSNKHKSQNRHSDEKKDSHKSSHSREKHHKSGESDRKHRKEEKSRHDKKRKHEEEPSSGKKKRYESDEYDDDDSAASPDRYNESALQAEYPDSILSEEHDHESVSQSEDYRENTQSPVPVEEVKNSSKHKKHNKSDKHRSHEKDSEKNVNGHSSSNKKSSHRDKESKRSEEKSSRSDKSSPSKKSDSKESKSKHTSSSSPSKSSEKMLSPSKMKKGIMIQNDNGIDSGSGASFAEALGMIEPTKGSSSKTTYKKKIVYSAPASPTPSTSTLSTSTLSTSTLKSAKPRTQSPLAQSPNLLAPNIKLEPLVLNTTLLPDITTNYKPLQNNFSYDASSMNHLKHMTEDEALSVVISSKTQRTKVYSGNKTNWGYVPTLFNLCVRVLQDNIDSLEFTGGVPYEILKPVLERATANQLLNAEYYNPYLIEETDELWELHGKRECKGQKRQEMETWREMYLRCRDERDAKLKALTVNIKQSIDKCLPVRQTKLAYVDSVVKPPRGIARKQAKYGTDKKPTITPSARLSLIAAGGPDKVSVPNPGARAAASSSSAALIKPKKAPLMQKTLALMKGRFGRR